MTVTVARDLYTEAEERLGRVLTASERAIDLDADVATLEHAKALLAAEIEKEKRRAIRRFIDGGGSELRVTAAMAAILMRLYDAGKRAAEAEIERLGVTPVATFAAVDRLATDPALAPLLAHLTAGLRGVSKRIADEGYTQIIGTDVTGSALARAIDRRVPGALDVASRMVSTPFYAGMGATFEQNTALFDGWMYSAVMDRGTCPICASLDGRLFDTWDDIMAVLPNGGPNPACHGGGRCRCRAVPRSDEFAVGGAADGQTKGSVAKRILGDHEGTKELYADPLTGDYTLERKRLHDRIVAKYLSTGVPRKPGQRQAFFMAGGSGAGKSSALKLLDDVPTGAVKIDPDEIKDMLPEFAEMVRRKERYAARAAHEESSDLAKRILRESNTRGYNVIVDGTGNNADPASFIGKMQAQKDLGYDVRLMAVNLNSDEAWKRAKIRAEGVEPGGVDNRGNVLPDGKPGSGRFVPEAMVRDIHEHVSARFAEYADNPLVREWTLFTNEVEPPVLIAAKTRGKIVIYDEGEVATFLEKGMTPQEARAVIDGWKRKYPPG